MTELSPEPLRDPQRDPIVEANAYRDTMPENEADELSLARGEIAWLREAIRRSTLVDENAMLRDAAARGLEWVIEAANARKQKDGVFENAMRDIARIEAALSHKETNR